MAAHGPADIARGFTTPCGFQADIEFLARGILVEVGELQRLVRPGLPHRVGRGQHHLIARSRRANLGNGFHETPVHLGTSLKPGHEVMGPAIIDETFTTIVVYPGWKARVDDAGDYEMAQAGAAAP